MIAKNLGVELNDQSCLNKLINLSYLSLNK